MKVSNNFNTNFGALFGKKEVTSTYMKDRSVKISTLQHVYPFKDEFKSKEEMYNWLEELKESSFYKEQNNSSHGVIKNFSVVIEPELPFTKETFECAKRDGVQLLHNPSDFYSVTSKYYGYYPSYTFENGRFDCII
ncbi:MAG: hypothetical protein IJB79_02125 [Candidatus Gastranaerophilales bacterium]|nr:hypothetical protein [Candidatus Gastranaerophilales bacterium]